LEVLEGGGMTGEEVTSSVSKSPRGHGDLGRMEEYDPELI